MAEESHGTDTGALEGLPRRNDALLSVLASAVWLAGIGSIVGILLGVSALRTMRHGPPKRREKTYAILGCVLGVLGLWVTFWVAASMIIEPTTT